MTRLCTRLCRWKPNLSVAMNAWPKDPCSRMPSAPSSFSSPSSDLAFTFFTESPSESRTKSPVGGWAGALCKQFCYRSLENTEKYEMSSFDLPRQAYDSRRLRRTFHPAAEVKKIDFWFLPLWTYMYLEKCLIVLTVSYLALAADSSTRPLAVTIAEATKTRATQIILEVSMMVARARSPNSRSWDRWDDVRIRDEYPPG